MSVRARAVILMVGLLETAIVYFHVLGIQQTRYWSWSFRNGRPWPLYPALAAAALPMAIALLLHLRHRGPTWIRLALIAVSVLAIQPLALMFAYHPAEPGLPVALVQDRYTTSYWNDARQLVRQRETLPEILRTYPQRLPAMYVHSRNKPPGFVMFYYALLRMLGTANDRAALVGAATIAAGTAAGAFGVYALSIELLDETDAAFWAALVFALTPAVLGVFPQFDSCFAAVGCAMLWLWLRTLRTQRWIYPTALGALLAALLFCTSNLLVLGSLMIALIEWERHLGRRHAWRTAAIAALWIAALISAIYLAGYLSTGYNPFTTAQAYARIEYQFEHTVSHRPWPWIVPSDFFHFCFGTGRMLVLIAGAALLLPLSSRQMWAIRLCLLQIVFVGCTGLLRGETTRLWIFLMPLLEIPVGLVLARWPVRWRLAACGVLFAFAVVMLQNVEFNTRPLPGL